MSLDLSIGILVCKLGKMKVRKFDSLGWCSWFDSLGWCSWFYSLGWCSWFYSLGWCSWFGFLLAKIVILKFQLIAQMHRLHFMSIGIHRDMKDIDYLDRRWRSF
jgi:hypothetical protein